MLEYSYWIFKRHTYMQQTYTYNTSHSRDPNQCFNLKVDKMKKQTSCFWRCYFEGMAGTPKAARVWGDPLRRPGRPSKSSSLPPFIIIVINIIIIVVIVILSIVTMVIMGAVWLCDKTYNPNQISFQDAFQDFFQYQILEALSETCFGSIFFGGTGS